MAHHVAHRPARRISFSIPHLIRVAGPGDTVASHSHLLTEADRSRFRMAKKLVLPIGCHPGHGRCVAARVPHPSRGNIGIGSGTWSIT